MARFKEEDVLGLWIGEDCVCRTHLTPDEVSHRTLEQIITERDLDGEVLFCARCDKEITAL